jgi:hypothetical protein
MSTDALSHFGLLRSEHSWREHRTVYSGRSEADVVMASRRTEHAAIGGLYLNFKQGRLPGVNRCLQCIGHLDGVTDSTAWNSITGC